MPKIDLPRSRVASCPDDHRHTRWGSGATITRRRVLELTGGAGIGSLAGCLGGFDGAASDKPVEPADDASCGVCEMMPARYPDWNAQVILVEDARVHFCSPGCFVVFYADPARFVDGRSRKDITAGWVTDHASREWTDAMTASYVLETNADRIDAPMMKNPVPFTREADARAYVDRYDDLSAAAVVGIDAFDVALAETYRGRLFA